MNNTNTRTAATLTRYIARLTVGLAITTAALTLTACDTSDTTTHNPSPGIIQTDGEGSWRPGAIEEDDPRWDCRTMGNRVCGPDNAQGVPAGDYSPCWIEHKTDGLPDETVCGDPSLMPAGSTQI